MNSSQIWSYIPCARVQESPNILATLRPSDVNKDWTCKDKDKDLTHKDQDKGKDLNLVLKESL